MSKNFFGRGQLLVTALLLIALLALPVAGTAHAAVASAQFSGQAYVAHADILSPVPASVVVVDTGPIASSGGNISASAVDANSPGLLTASVLHASVVAQGNASRSEAAATNLGLTVASNAITADVVMSRANAVCSGTTASAGGSSQVVNLVVNGTAINVSGAPNQTVTLPGGLTIVINEQIRSVSGGASSITVNALHVTVAGIADVIISSSHADITCNAGVASCINGFSVTGAGRLYTTTPPAGAYKDFSLDVGKLNGVPFGYFNWYDHHSNGPIMQSTSITSVTRDPVALNHFVIKGTATVNGQSGYTFTALAQDNGPTSSDWIKVSVSNGYASWGNLLHGNIQKHGPCGS